LGGADERTQLQMKDLVRDIVLADRRGGIALPDNERREWPISDRLLYLGYGRLDIYLFYHYTGLSMFHCGYYETFLCELPKG
ncbi:MAG: hypothetical protein J7540_20815, partial [Roseofilum sp. SID2]